MPGDPIINLILDHFLAATGIDPSCVEPDQKLKADLSLSQNEIDSFLNGLLKDKGLALPAGFDFNRSVDLTMKQMYGDIKSALGSPRNAA